MPTLRYFVAAGAPRVYCVHKPLTTIGKALGNDVAVPGVGMSEHHAQILFDGRDFSLEELDKDGEIAINGKRKRRARLVHGDRVQLGSVELAFSMFSEARSEPKADDDAPSASGGPGVSAELAGVRKLFAFSEKLINRRNVDELLEAMLDDVIELTHADKGFLLLIEGDDPTVKPTVKGEERRLSIRASRNVRKEAITNAQGAISDSIVRQVIEKARRIAAHLLEAAEGDVEFAGGTFSVAGSPDATTTIQDVSLAAFAAHNLPEGMEPTINAEAVLDPDSGIQVTLRNLFLVEVLLLPSDQLFLQLWQAWIVWRMSGWLHSARWQIQMYLRPVQR